MTPVVDLQCRSMLVLPVFRGVVLGTLISHAVDKGVSIRIYTLTAMIASSILG